MPRGEQRALLAVGVLLFCSIFVRLTVSFLPEKPPPGMDRFREECRAIRKELHLAEMSGQTDPEVKSGQTDPEVKSGQTDREVKSGQTDREERSLVISSGEAFSRPQVPVVDINRADSADLLPLPGIGPVLAGRIIKFRNLLGGFVFADQLQQVYGLSQETFLQIRGSLSVDPTAVRKMDLDSVSFRELLRHPYLDLEQVKSFVQYRDIVQPPVTVMQLKKNYIWADSVIERIKPYLVD